MEDEWRSVKYKLRVKMVLGLNEISPSTPRIYFDYYDFSPCPTFREASVNQNHSTTDSVSQRGIEKDQF